MKVIRNHQDLAAHFGVGEDWIEKAVYEGTACGAWTRLEESVPVGKWTEDTWLFDIRHSILGMALRRVRRLQDREWTAPKDAPKAVLECLDGHTFRGGCCILTNEDTIEFVKGNQPQHPSKYFRVEGVQTYRGGYAQGVSFGSIVEGVDMTTDIYTIPYPCQSDEIEAALQSVEQEASNIWDETHGCPDCWGGDETVNEWGWISQNGNDLGARRVDPNCPTCHGEGIIL